MAHLIPVRSALFGGWQFTDFPQTPAVVLGGVKAEVGGFFSELSRKLSGSPDLPFNYNPGKNLNRMGRPQKYSNNTSSPFANFK